VEQSNFFLSSPNLSYVIKAGRTMPEATMNKTDYNGTQTTYRVAIALNNIGVDLLEKGCFSQACDTHKDAVGVIMEAHKVAEHVHPMIIAFHRNDLSNLVLIKDCLHAALTRVCISRDPSRETHPNSRINAISDKNVAQTLEKMGQVFNRSASQPSTTFTYSPVKIDSGKSISDGLLQFSLDFETSVILFNFAIAHLCLAETVEDSKSAETHMQIALQLLCYANDIAAVKCYGGEHLEALNLTDPFHLYRLLLLMAMILQNTVRLFCVLGMDDRAGEAAQRFFDLESVALQHREVLRLYITSASAAA
jgi:hypothetical protein